MALFSYFDTFMSGTTVSGTVARTGRGWDPKCGITWTNGRTDSANAIGARDILPSIGVWTSTSNRGCCSAQADEAVGTSATDSVYRDDCVVAQLNTSGTSIGALDLSSLTDGPTWIRDTAFTNDTRIFSLEFGGSDIEQATVVEVTGATATGNFDITTIGFTPDVCIFISAQRGSAPSTTSFVNLMQVFGVAAMDPTGNIQQFVTAFRQTDGGVIPRCFAYTRSGECMTFISASSTTHRATATAMLSNGIRLNYTEATATAHRFFVLAIKGGKWNVANFLSATNTTEYDGPSLGFQPTGGLFVSGGRAEDASDTISFDFNPSFGCYNNPFPPAAAQKGVASCFGDDGGDPSVLASAVNFDNVYLRHTVAAGTTIDGTLQVNGVTGDTFKLQMSDADSSQAFIGVLAWGDAAKRVDIAYQRRAS